MKTTAIEQRELSAFVDSFPYWDGFRGKTILITGARGLIGAALTKLLLFANERLSLELELVLSTRDVSQPLDYVGATDPVSVIPTGESFVGELDYIVHAAAPTTSKYFIEHSKETFDAIVDGSLYALEEAKRHGAKVLLLSSIEVYAGIASLEPVGEDRVGHPNPADPRSSYPLGKIVSEFLSAQYAREGTFSMVARLSPVLGLFQSLSDNRLTNQVLKCCLEGKDLPLMNPSFSRSVVFSLDACTALLTLLCRGEKGATYNITNPDTFEDVLESTNRVFARLNPGRRCYYAGGDAASMGYVSPNSFNMDVSRIYSLSWRPRYGLLEIYALDCERFGKVG